jgi:hypothetical protein
MSMQKPSKISKKGFDPPGNNYIALGSRTQSSDSLQNVSNKNSASTLSLQNDYQIASATSTSTSNQNISQTHQTTSNSTNSSNGKSKQHSNNNEIPLIEINTSTIKDEIVKVLDKDDNDKLIKLVYSMINSLKISQQPNLAKNILNQQQQQQQQQQTPDLNYLMAISYISIRKPNFFLKHPNIIDYMCRELLFTSNRLASTSSSSVLLMKSKLLRPGGSVNPSINQNCNGPTINASICTILNLIYENETNWPDIFIKAYIDDFLAERSWVDNSVCKEFVANIQTGFNTKQIPFNVDNNGERIMNVNQIKSMEEEEVDGVMNSESHFVRPRYSSNLNQIQSYVIDLIKNKINLSNKSTSQTMPQRALGNFKQKQI